MNANQGKEGQAPTQEEALRRAKPMKVFDEQQLQKMARESALEECASLCVRIGDETAAFYAAAIRALSEGQAPEPVAATPNVLYGRCGDMTPRGESVLRILIQPDGDVCLSIQSKDEGWAGIEFCASGGKSVRTLHALHRLTAAVAADNEASPSAAWPPTGEQAPEPVAQEPVAGSGLPDAALLRNLAEDVPDMHPTVREHLRAIAREIQRATTVAKTKCDRCGWSATVEIHEARIPAGMDTARAKAIEECIQIAAAHRAKPLDKTSRRFATEEALATIRDEERGEEIAAAEIAGKLRALATKGAGS